MIFDLENWQLNTVSICAWLNVNLGVTWKKIDFETNSIFCRVRTWFLQATQAVKIKFELDKKLSLFQNQFLFEFEIEKKSGDTQYFKNQVEIDRGKVALRHFLLLLVWKKQNWFLNKNILPLGPCPQNPNTEVTLLTIFSSWAEHSLKMHRCWHSSGHT